MSSTSQETIDNSPLNVIKLTPIHNSNITSVKVYPNSAEITRVFRCNIKIGQNQVNISGLPKVLDSDSLRVEAHGTATIHGVTISTIVPPLRPTSSDTLKELLDKKRRTEKACERCKKSLNAVETNLGSLKIEHPNDPITYGDAEILDEKIAELEKTLAETNDAISAEKQRLSGPTEEHNANLRLNIKVSFGVVADFEGEIEIAFTYAVQSATWNAEYDIRVAKDKAGVTFIYKGGITQNTGEDWDGVTLTLEAATYPFRLEVPTLTPWNIYGQPQIVKKSVTTSSVSSNAVPRQTPSPLNQWKRPVPSNEPSNQPIEDKRRQNDSNTGKVGAIFQADSVSIPSGNIIHNVTIAKPSLDATISWVCVPKKDVKTYLNANIKNTSEYTFLNGRANVYIDGSFVLKSDVPFVNPDESFDFLLGVEPTIQVRYHPCSKRVSQGGFYTKTANYVFSQRITVSNTNTYPIENLKIIDQIPVCEDSDVTVKLITPALVVPRESCGESKISGEPKAFPPLKVASGIIAQWHGADEREVELEALGRNGKLNWVCSVPAQEKIRLDLQWKVTAPVKTELMGLKINKALSATVNR